MDDYEQQIRELTTKYGGYYGTLPRNTVPYQTIPVINAVPSPPLRSDTSTAPEKLSWDSYLQPEWQHQHQNPSVSLYTSVPYANSLSSQIAMAHVNRYALGGEQWPKNLVDPSPLGKQSLLTGEALGDGGNKPAKVVGIQRTTIKKTSRPSPERSSTRATLHMSPLIGKGSDEESDFSPASPTTRYSHHANSPGSTSKSKSKPKSKSKSQRRTTTSRAVPTSESSITSQVVESMELRKERREMPPDWHQDDDNDIAALIERLHGGGLGCEQELPPSGTDGDTAIAYLEADPEPQWQRWRQQDQDQAVHQDNTDPFSPPRPSQRTRHSRLPSQSRNHEYTEEVPSLMLLSQLEHSRRLQRRSHSRHHARELVLTGENSRLLKRVGELQGEVEELKEQVFSMESELWTRRESIDELKWLRSRLEEAEAELEGLRAAAPMVSIGQ